MNAVNGNGQSALHGAAQSGWNNLVQLLADHGAVISAKDHFGRTPLDVAEGKSGLFGTARSRCRWRSAQGYGCAFDKARVQVLIGSEMQPCAR
jgi:hypothetical protein